MTKYNTFSNNKSSSFIIQNDKNHSLTRKHFQLASRTLRHWINQFNHSRVNDLAVLGKKRNYSPKFKLNVIQTIKMDNFLQKLPIYAVVLPIQE